MAKKKTKSVKGVEKKTKKVVTPKADLKKQTTSLKKTEKVELKKAEPTISKKKEVSLKKDIITIVILAILIIAIILISIFSSGDNSNGSNDLNDMNGPIIDVNLDSNILTSMTLEEIEIKSANLQLKILKEVRDAQLDLLKTKYSELGLDAEQMNQCLDKSYNFGKDLKLTESDIILKIQTDTFLAQSLGIKGTPGIYVNGYFINGAQDYNFASKVIDLALEEPTLDLNYENKNFLSDLNAEPKLTVFYNDNHELTKNNTYELIEFMKTSDQLNQDFKDFFISLFDEVEMVYLPYDDETSINMIQSIGLSRIPSFYLDGNIDSLDIMDDKNSPINFQNLFVQTETNGYVLSPSITSELISVANITILDQLVNYKIMEDELDYVIGQKDAPVRINVFTDYDCPYCQMFEEDTQRLIIENYVDKNKASLVIKDFVVHEMSALFPAIFSRCAEGQGKYLETHELLFSIRDELGQTAIVNPIMESYQKEIEELNDAYQQLNDNN